jgi:preprotein translocase subunit YajC
MPEILGTALPLIVMLGLFYIIVFIPENKRKKKYNAMLESLKVNDEVLTRGGIMGKITSIQEDHVLVQTGPDRARLKISKNGIASVVAESKTE